MLSRQQPGRGVCRQPPTAPARRSDCATGVRTAATEKNFSQGNLERVVSSTYNYHAVSHRRPSWRQLHSAGGAWASGRGAGAPNTREGAPDNDGGAGAHGGEGHSKGDAGSQACTGGSAAGVRDDDVEDQAASDPDVSDGEAADASRVRVVSSTDYETVWSIPNMITMGRIVAAPVLAGLVVYEQYPVAVFGASRETA